MKRESVLIVVLLLVSQGAAGERLPVESLQYAGYFLPPPNQGHGDAGTWDYGMRGLTLIPDCMGVQDPSPGDGFPGCLGAFGHVSGFQFGVFDIVPPGSQAQQVVPFYELGAPIAEAQAGRSEINYWDVYYDRSDSYCRLWWTYFTWYTPADDPFLGVSNCVPGAPSPQGMWGFGQAGLPPGEDPLHSSKMHKGLSLIPEETANRLFDGKRMMVGIPRKDGTQGGSQGPSLYVRPLDLPTVPSASPVMDATPLVWYEFTSYMQWYDNPQMDGPVVHRWPKSSAEGAEFIYRSGAEAVVLPWAEPIINVDDYPCSDPFAYRDEDPTTPAPCEVPVCWYGSGSCEPGAPEGFQPSFWEDTSNGAPMPMDCNISDEFNPYQGDHCKSIRPFLILYDVEELAAVYRGEEPHQYPQPYAKIPLEGYLIDGTSFGGGLVGSTYDQGRQLLFIAQGDSNPVAVHIFRIVEPVGVFQDGFESGDLSAWSQTVQ